MSKRSKQWLVLGCVCIVLLGALVGEKLSAGGREDKGIQNVILLVGDGMGLSYTSAYRYYKNEAFPTTMKQTAFDPYLMGTVMTYPNDKDQNITDSAAAATAMASGIKTYNGAVGVDVNKKRVKTVLERAKEKGMATGLVVTSKVTDATPACFASHVEKRWSGNEIANQYMDDKIQAMPKVDVLLGGGLDDFVRKDRNLVEEFKAAGYSFVKTERELRNDTNDRVLGLFAPRYLPKMIDRTKDIPSLRQMTKAALKRLNQSKKGFFLMVEGSQIDIAGHRNDIVGVMSEMTDFEAAFEAAIDFAKKDKHTLVLMTADHSTGGLTVGANRVYSFDCDPIRKTDRTVEYIAEEINSGSSMENVFRKYVHFPLTKEEKQVIARATGKALSREIGSLFAMRSHTGWTTTGHTGEDIPIYGFGPGSSHFRGVHENTEIGKYLLQWLK